MHRILDAAADADDAGQTEAARELFERAIELTDDRRLPRPVHGPARVVYANFPESHGEYDHALELAVPLTEQYPKA